MNRLETMEAIMNSTKSAITGLQDKIDQMNSKLDLLNELYDEFMEAVRKEEGNKDG